MLGKYASSLGLIFDVVGVGLLAFEIFKPCKGGPTVQVSYDKVGGPVLTTGYELWKAVKGRYGAWGLVFVGVGFLLQLLGIWV
jgi:hypothetical protein